MGLWDKITGELIDIIEWLDDSNDTIAYRFERHNNEIKNGAQLTVREGQMAVFVNEGQIADVFAPGRYELKTENLPILSTLKGWKYGFESPFKAEVYFISTRRFTDQKWGTKNPIIMRDPEFGAVRVRAFGTYVFRVIDPATFIREIVGTDGDFSTDEITDQLRDLVVSRFADKLGEARIPLLDLAANYDEIGEQLLGAIQNDVSLYGLKISKLLVENISLPPAVEEAIDKRGSMNVIGNMQQYSQFQAANAIESAAQNGNGGMMGGAMGAGLGFGMANQMANAFGQQQQQAPVAAPPPLQQAVQYYAAINGQQAGPFPIETVQSLVNTNQITKDTLVWKQGMSQWSPAGQVAEVAAMFAAGGPPPIPGA